MAKRREASVPKKSQPATKKRAASRSAPAKSRKVVAGTNGTGRVEVVKPVPKTKLPSAAVEEFKELLIHKRRQLVGDVDSMEGEALRKNRTSAAGDLSMMPIHMADIGTDNYEQEFTIGLIENEREVLKEIDAALDRVSTGTYGVCIATHRQISRTRLRAKPWARYCIEYKREEESRRK